MTIVACPNRASSQALWLSLAAVPLAGQGPPPRPTRLAPAVQAVPLELTRVTGVRELAGGGLLVLDAGDARLWFVPAGGGAPVVVGRSGAGPGEYTGPSALFPLAGDSTLLVDLRGGRWLLLDGTAIVATISPGDPVMRAGGRRPLGADLAGRIIATAPMVAGGVPAGGQASLPDSVRLVRLDRRSGQRVDLAVLRTRPGRVSVRGPRDHPTSIEIVINPLAVGEQAALFPDGWIAVARLDPFRVEWLPPGGRTVVGPPLPDPKRPVDDREKRALLAREAERRGAEPRAVEAVTDWPHVLPPFRAGALLTGARGTLWIRRTPTAAEPETVYDVVDRRGLLITRVMLSPNEGVVGVGPKRIYVVVTDAGGIQHLRVHPALGPVSGNQE